MAELREYPRDGDHDDHDPNPNKDAVKTKYVGRCMRLNRERDTYLQPRSVYRNMTLAIMAMGVKNTVQSSANA